MPQIATSHNIGFAKAGVNFSCVESFVIISRKKPFRFLFFCNFEKTKMDFARFVFIEVFGFLSPAFAKPFPVIGKRIRPHRQNQTTDKLNEEIHGKLHIH